jgi:hypothetical protein
MTSEMGITAPNPAYAAAPVEKKLYGAVLPKGG